MLCYRKIVSFLVLFITLISTYGAVHADTNVCITVYEHAQSDQNGGRSQQLCGAAQHNVIFDLRDYSLSGFTEGWNDQISSMDIPSGYEVRVWEHAYQQGKTEIIYSGRLWSQDLSQSDTGPAVCGGTWNDCITSLQICLEGECTTPPDQTFQAEFVSKEPTSVTLKPGDRQTLKLTLKNSGQIVWPKGIIKLGTAHPDYNGSQSPTDDQYFDYKYALEHSSWSDWNRPVILDRDVLPGGTVTFQFDIQAPTTGSVPNRFVVRPIAENISWMAEYGYWDITIETTSPNNPPNKPSLNQPEDNAKFTTGETINFSWSGSDPDGDSLRYSILIATDPNFTSESIVAGDGHQFDEQDLHDTNFSWTPSVAGVYYWRAIAFDGQVSGAWSDYRTLTIEDSPPENTPPNPPTLGQPEDNAKFTTGETINFSWSGSDPDGDSLRYSILIATDPNFTSESIVAGDGHQFDEQDLHDTNFSWTPSEAGVYYWRVIAFDGQVSGAWSDYRKIVVRNPLVFVPGIMGSRLSDKYRQLWPPTNTGREWYLFHHNDLRYPDNRFPKLWATDVIRDYHGDVYGEMLKTLREKGGYEEYQVNNDPYRRTYPSCDVDSSGNLFVFAYDWRLDIAETALAPDGVSYDVDESQSLQNYVNCINRIYPGAKVDILAHSMGGLVASKFALSYPTKVDNLITMGTPWLGAPEAIHTLATGDIGMSGADKIKGIVKDLTRNTPGVHQLLPSKAYFSFYSDDDQRPIRENGYDLDGDGNGNKDDIFTYDQYKSVINHNYSNAGNHNEAFHTTNQDNWSNDNKSFNYYPIIGLRRNSKDEIIRDTVGQVIWEWECHQVIGDEHRCQTKVDTKMTSGDQTVPYYSATKATRDGSLNYNPSDTPICEINEDHGMNKDDLLENYIIKILESDKPVCPGETWQRSRQQWRFASMYQLHVYGVAEILITDQNGLTTGLDKATESYIYDNEDVQFLVSGDDSFAVYLSTDQTFNIRLQPKDGKTVSIELKKDDGTTVTEAIRYNDLNIPANTLLELQLTPDGIQPLQQDTDGDETVDSEVMPTAHVSGEQASDTDSPTMTITIGEVTTTNQALVTISAQDVGSAGVAQTYVSTDGTYFNVYSQPFTVDVTAVYTVYAFADDTIGNRSGLYSQATPRSTVPSTPINLIAEPGHASVQLTWNATNGTEVTHYRIARTVEGSTDFTTIEASWGETTYFDHDTDLVKETTYCYQVEAIEENGNSYVTSNTACAKYGELALWIPEVKATAGDTQVIVPVNLRNADGLQIAATDIWVDFDPTVIQSVAISQTSLTQGYLWAKSVQDTETGQRIRIAALDNESPPELLGEGSIFWLTFDVVGSAGSSSPLTIQPFVSGVGGGGSTIYTPDDLFNHVALTIDNGQFSVADNGQFILGDVNGDGLIDGADISLLLTLVNDQSPSTNQLHAGDINGSGDLDAADASMILYYVAHGSWPTDSNQSRSRQLPSSTTLQLLDGQGAPGQLVELKLTATNLENISGAEFVLAYDPQLIAGLETVELTGLTQGFAHLEAYDDQLGRIFIALADDTPLNGNGELLTIRLKLASGVEKSRQTTVRLADAKLNTVNGLDFVTSFANTTILRRSATVMVEGGNTVYLPVVVK